MTGPEWNLFPENLNVSKQNKSKFWKKMLRSGHLWSRATAVNISRVTVNYFPFDVMLPAHGIWRETVSFLDALWPSG